MTGYRGPKPGTAISFLDTASDTLAPYTKYLSKNKLVGPFVSAIIRFGFFLGFIVLLMSDHLLRAIFRLMIGKHPTGRYFSCTNAMDPNIQLFDHSIPRTIHLENSELFKQRKQLVMTEQNEGPESRALTGLLKRPKYSVPLAYTLAVASKLVYEDVEVIKYELAKAGFDERSFRPIAYKNICAFITEKDDDILLVFRGTNPLNIQNYLTNVSVYMTEVKASWGPMGKVHEGFWTAMGEARKKRKSKKTVKETYFGDEPLNIKIELINTSIYRTVISAFQGAAKIIKFLTSNLFHHVKEPIDSTWIGPDIDIRTHSMYAQAEQYIMELIEKEDEMSDTKSQRRRSGLSHGGSRNDGVNNDKMKRKKRLFITGHSLGGALGTIFLSKMLQSESPLLEYFAGLYTYGQPKIGDAEFSRVFSPRMTSKIFHHAYNNDIVPRSPIIGDYYTPPGTLVFIDSAYNITLYPPNPYTNEPVPVRPISYLHLSGLLNRYVISRLRNENKIRILFRVIFPFFLNDHFPSDYIDSLRHGTIHWVIMGAGGIEGGSEEQHLSVNKRNGPRRYSMVDVAN
ncbi:Alpha/Beta hydrolase protein [Pilobolus umbonatus]|nr:Alpha/Beta hydrolase protein [Pilobolus umbonatus]